MAKATSWSRGRRAERIAAWWLRLHGYQILAERHKTPHGEIDLIARRQAALAFIEVKARNTLPDGLIAISPRQQQRIRAAAEAFLAKHRLEASCRFDAIIVTPGFLGLPRITHRKNAWS